MVEVRTKAPFTKAKSTQLQTWPDTRQDTELRLSASDVDMGSPSVESWRGNAEQEGQIGSPLGSTRHGWTGKSDGLGVFSELLKRSFVFLNCSASHCILNLLQI